MSCSNLVFCLCCKSHVSRKTERQHRLHQRENITLSSNQVGHDQPNPLKRKRQSLHNALEKGRLESTETESNLFSGNYLNEISNDSVGINHDIDVNLDLNALHEDISTVLDIEPEQMQHEDDDFILEDQIPNQSRWNWDMEDEDEFDEDSGNGDLEEVPQEDGGDDEQQDLIDWEALATESGLTAWDQLAENSERRFAETGMLQLDLT